MASRSKARCGLCLLVLVGATLSHTQAAPGDKQAKEAQLTRAIATAYYARGYYYAEEIKAYDKAVADFTEAIRLDPEYADAYVSRGTCWEDKGDYAKALRDYQEAVKVAPKAPSGYNNQAWLMATCPEAKFRDAKKAVEFATKACELSGWENYRHLDTLAAAYAEAGQFDRAVELQGKALKVAAPKDRERLGARLKLYKAGKPYRVIKGTMPE